MQKSHGLSATAKPLVLYLLNTVGKSLKKSTGKLKILTPGKIVIHENNHFEVLRSRNELPLASTCKLHYRLVSRLLYGRTEQPRADAIISYTGCINYRS